MQKIQETENFQKNRELHFSSANWPRNLLIVALFTEGWLIFLHLRLATGTSATHSVLGQTFDFTRESSLPTYVGSLIALGVAATAFLVYLLKAGPGKSKYSWLGVAALFATISFDDAIGMHERIGAVTSLKLMKDLSYPSYPWHITFAPFVGGGLLVVVFLIWRDVRSISGLASMLVLGLFCYVAAFGLDVIEGIEQMAVTRGSSPEVSPSLPLLMLTEEVLEIAATSFFLYVTYSYLLALTNKMKFGVSNQPLIDGAILEAEPEIREEVERSPGLDPQLNS